METLELTLEEQDKAQFARENIVEIINRALDCNNIYLSYFHLKNIKNMPDKLILDEIVFEKLLNFMERYTSHEHLLPTDFDSFMSSFLKKVEPISITLHLKCLSYTDNIDLEYYRKTFSYSKIYLIFQNITKSIFTEVNNHRYIKLVIMLLDNSRLVYKNLLPIISKLSLYVRKNIIDRNIVNCCMALNALVETVPNLFDQVLIISLLSYFVQQLYDPQTYLIIKRDDIKVLINTLRCLTRFEFSDLSIKKSALGLLRECIEKIEEYKVSTVYEEMQVVLSMVQILPSIFDLSRRYGNRDFSFIDTNFFEMNQDKITGLKNNFYEINELNNPAINVREVIHENSDIIRYREVFFEYKYYFLDRLNFYKKCFDRIKFYNDLSIQTNPNNMLKHLLSFKTCIEWSDMITLACSSKFKEGFIPFIFDSEFLASPEHKVYLNLFLKSIENDEDTLVYSTKMAILKGCDYLMMYLYLINIKSSDNRSKKRRLMILEYLNSLKTSDSSKLNEISEHFSSFVQEYSLNSNIIALCILLSKTSNNMKIFQYLNKVLREYCEGEKSISNLISKEIPIFKIALIQIENENNQVLEGEDEMRIVTSKFSENKELLYYYVSLAALILNYNAKDLGSVEIISYYDALIVLLAIRTRKSSEKEFDDFKLRSFEVLLNLSGREIAELKTLLKESGEKSEVFQKYTQIADL